VTQTNGVKADSAPCGSYLCLGNFTSTSNINCTLKDLKMGDWLRKDFINQPLYFCSEFPLCIISTGPQDEVRGLAG
jgi:hypothetical protein